MNAATCSPISKLSALNPQPSSLPPPSRIDTAIDNLVDAIAEDVAGRVGGRIMDQLAEKLEQQRKRRLELIRERGAAQRALDQA